MPATPSIDDLVAQEKRAVLNRFDYAMAWQLGVCIHDIAAEQSLPIAIEVTHGSSPVFFALMPGATPDNSDWVRRKRMVALRFCHSSLYMRLLCEKNQVNFNMRFRLPEEAFVASGGGVPIVVQDVGVVGAAAVSGLPDVEDHAIIIRALEDIGAIPKLAQ